MDMLYFGDTVSYAYQPSYKQTSYRDFTNTCAYQTVGPVANSACRFSSVSPPYGAYTFQPGTGCNGFFSRKPTRIKGILHLYFAFELKNFNFRFDFFNSKIN